MPTTHFVPRQGSIDADWLNEVDAAVFETIPADEVRIAAAEDKLETIEEGADVTDAANVTAAITGSPETTTPADANLFGIVVSGVLNFLSFANLRATLATTLEFLQSGTGAVSRTLRSKLRDNVHVADFGAVGDGVTNDAAAIQAGIDHLNTLGGGRLIFAARNYNIGTTSLNIYSGIWIEGETYVYNNTIGSIITYTGSGRGIQSATRDTARIFSGGFRNINIKGSGKVSGSVGIDFRRIDDFMMLNTYVVGFDTGVNHDGTGSGGYSNKWYGGAIVGNNTGALIQNQANEQLFSGVHIALNTNYGIDIQTSSTNSIAVIQPRFESNGTHIRNAGADVRVLFGRMEGATVRSWETTSTSTYFSIMDVNLSSTNTAAPLDNGQFTRIRWRDHDSARGYNMVRNGSFEAWSAGTTSAPDRWTLSNVTVARDPDEQSGEYSALVTPSTIGGVIFQDVPLPLLWADGRKEFLVTVRLKLGTSTEAALQTLAQDSGGTTQGSTFDETFNAPAGSRILTTTAGWHTLKAVVRPNSSATRIRVGVNPDRDAGTGTCYVDAFNVSPLGAGKEEYYENTRDLAPNLERILVSTLTHDFDATDGGTQNLTVPGAASGDGVQVTAPFATADVMVSGYVSSADTVTVVKRGAGDPASATYVVMVFKR